MRLVNSEPGPIQNPIQATVPLTISVCGSSLISQFIGRQPILDSSGRTFGYELLYRAGSENLARVADGNVASATVIDAALAMGLDLLCGGKKAFINCTEDLLVNKQVEILPAEMVVLEVLETVPVTEKVIQACFDLKQAGYTIALDDYTHTPERKALLPVADIVKVEPQRISPATVRSIHEQCGKGVRLLAEKVETWTQVKSMSRAGCDLFQGYFFARPEMVEVRELSPSSAAYLRIMGLLASDRIGVAELVNELKREPALCYRLLRYLNSYHFGFNGEIRSLSHAVALIGEEKFKRWLSVATLAMAGVNACGELLQTAMIRARFCELLSPYAGARSEDLFLTGLLSLFDVVLNISKEQLVAELAVSQDVRLGLLSVDTVVGQCRELVEAYCCGDWLACSDLAAQAGIDEGVLPLCYANALTWAQSLAF